MPTAPPMPIQRVPSGLPGPGGIGLEPCAHEESGGDHHGERCIWTIWKLPLGVGYAGWPTATPKRCHSLPRLYTVRLCETRLMTMPSGSLATVSDGLTAFHETGVTLRAGVLTAVERAVAVAPLSTLRPHTSAIALGARPLNCSLAATGWRLNVLAR